MNSISVTMVCKNEADVIQDSLKCASVIADEIIVVDTGSTDGTQNIARQFSKVKLFETPLNENLGAARNLSVDKAACDVVFWIDADEYIDNPQELRKYLQNTTLDAVYMHAVFEPGKYYCQLRAWKNGAYRWKWRIHTQPVPVDQLGLFDIANFEIVNKPLIKRKKLSRLPLLVMDIVESNDKQRKEILLTSFNGNYKAASKQAVLFFSRWVR